MLLFFMRFWFSIGLMPTWTKEQVEALSPDASSLKAARKLLSKSKWPSLGSSEGALWGECQGSGKKPYLTRIDLSEPAFKCSCPSRKFPCKHALALFILFTEDASRFTQEDAPDWLTDWLASRSSRKEAKVQKQAAPVNETAQAKRVASREQKVLAGLDELELWLHDLVRSGLMQLAAKPHKFLDDMAARMVDAQASGLARRLRELNAMSFSGQNWAQEALAKLGALQVIISSYRRQDDLPDLVRADLRRVVGWTDNQKELVLQEGVKDIWLVLAQSMLHEDSLRVRKTWLWGKASKKIALELSFSYGFQPFDTTLVLGQTFSGELVFFPSNYPLRAVFKEPIEPRLLNEEDLNALEAYQSFDELLDAYASALAKNCWLEQFPVYLEGITPCMFNADFILRDAEGKSLPVSSSFRHAWQLMALSGGQPIELFAEWDGYVLLPLCIWQGDLVVLGGK